MDLDSLVDSNYAIFLIFFLLLTIFLLLPLLIMSNDTNASGQGSNVCQRWLCSLCMKGNSCGLLHQYDKRGYQKVQHVCHFMISRFLILLIFFLLLIYKVSEY